MRKIISTDDVDMASLEQIDELANTLETLKEAAHEKLAELSDEIAEYPKVDQRKFDCLPDCFTHRYYGEMAIQILEGIGQPDECQAVTQDEADDIESAISDARNWLDQAGVPTELILYPPVRRRTRRPVQVAQIEKAIKEAAARAAEALSLSLSLSNTVDDGSEQRIVSAEVFA